MTGKVAPAGILHHTKEGRVHIKCVAHPEFGTRWVKRAHFVWWAHKHQRVPKGYVLHHVDEKPAHDVVSNLRLMTIPAHTSLHAKRKHASGVLGVEACWTAASHEKASKSHKGNTALLGYKFSAESRHKMSVSQTGRKHPESVKQKMSDTWARNKPARSLARSGWGHPWRLAGLDAAAVSLVN